MSLSNTLSSLAAELTSLGVSAASQPAVASAIVGAIGGPSAAVTNALSALKGAYGSARIQGLVDTIENAGSLPAGAQPLLDSLPKATDPKTYIETLNDVAALYSNETNALTSALTKIGL